jgi:hypothetical protein
MDAFDRIFDSTTAMLADLGPFGDDDARHKLNKIRSATLELRNRIEVLQECERLLGEVEYALAGHANPGWGMPAREVAIRVKACKRRFDTIERIRSAATAPDRTDHARVAAILDALAMHSRAS